MKKQHYKDFDRWHQLSQFIQSSSTPKSTRPGLIHWCNLGINIGSEIDGKGSRFTRPALILIVFNEHLVQIAPITSRRKTGLVHPPIIVNGKTEYLLLDQIRTIDTRRLENFIDEVDPKTLSKIFKNIFTIYQRTQKN